MPSPDSSKISSRRSSAIRGKRSSTSTLKSRIKRTDSRRVCVLVVDPTEETASLIHSFSLLGHEVVIVSQQDSKLNFECLEEFKLDTNLNSVENYKLFTQKIAKRYYVIACLAGERRGCQAAEEMSRLLKCPRQNREKTAAARYTSYETQRILKKKDAPSVSMRKLKSVTSAVKYQSGREFPCIIRSDSRDEKFFRICENLRDVKTIFEEGFKFTSCEELVIQTLCRGDEYEVQYISHTGVNLLLSIYKMEGKTRGPLLEFSSDPFSVTQQLVEFVPRVINSCGIIYGPSTTRCFITPIGPRVIQLRTNLFTNSSDLYPGETTDFWTVDCYANDGLRIYNQFTQPGWRK